MARPSKCRFVCGLPRCAAFLPSDPVEDPPVVLAVDEFETVRWMDHQGLDQEACAVRMGVSRATVQAMYDRARQKIATALVEGRALSIQGGSYRICSGTKCRRCCREKERMPMKRIAVCYENGNVFPHFGRTERFKLYDVKDGKIVSSTEIPAGDYSHEGLVELLNNEGVDTLVAGGMGGGARAALADAGITVYAGASGPADNAVEALLAGNLVNDPEAQCCHHHEGDCQHHHE